MLKLRPDSPNIAHWLRQARECERVNDLAAAFDAYQQALSLDPDSVIIVRHLADLAFRLSNWEIAEKLHAHLVVRGETETTILTAYAATLREQGRYDEAIAFLKPLLSENAQDARLWEALGSVMAAQGERDTALIFIEEALRLQPDNLHALFNRGCIRIEKGDLRQGLIDVADCARQFRDPGNRAGAELTCANTALAMGDLQTGWRWYDCRHMRGTHREVHYALKHPRKKPGQAIAGKNLFISAEQGLGDEVLFASLLPDIMDDLKDGDIGIGVEPRLVSLFQRSFPAATVVAHRTETRNGRIHRDFPDLDQKPFDLWALLGDFLASHRATIGDFPLRKSFLTADPVRVDHWRNYFAELNSQAKVGILWKSLKASTLRDRSFSPFQQWQDVLATPGVQFVNLQYGDTATELEAARAAGLDIHTPEGIDLKQDLDDLAALTQALAVTIGPPNATTNIAAACGAPVWLIMPPHPWLALGQPTYPWYPTARMFVADKLDDWEPVMKSVAEALKRQT